MTITMASSTRYIYGTSPATNFVGPPIRLTNINMPYFQIILFETTTATGTLVYQEGVSVDGDNTPHFTPIIWVTIVSIPVVNGLFTTLLPTPMNYFNFPSSCTPGTVNLFTAAQGCRLAWNPTSGGTELNANFQVGYFGKSLG